MDVVLQVLALAIACTCASGATYLALVRRAPPPAAPHSLEARVAELELERPRFVGEMTALVDQCEDLLDRTERKRKSIAASKSRDGSPPEVEPGPPEEENIESLAARDPVRARAVILASARRRGIR